MNQCMVHLMIGHVTYSRGFSPTGLSQEMHLKRSGLRRGREEEGVKPSVVNLDVCQLSLAALFQTHFLKPAASSAMLSSRCTMVGAVFTRSNLLSVMRGMLNKS